MAIPWMEFGVALLMSGLLLSMTQIPPPTIMPSEVEDYEGRAVVVAGFLDDVEVGVDRHRGSIVANGHAVRFTAEGTETWPEGTWVEAKGTLHRVGGSLILQVDDKQWIR